MISGAELASLVQSLRSGVDAVGKDATKEDLQAEYVALLVRRPAMNAAATLAGVAAGAALFGALAKALVRR
jgi:hypothetical protein